MDQTSEKFIRLSHLRKLRRCEQVAAVCYRVGDRGIEFLLVRTRGNRWTFPKGGTEPGLSHAQAAALEAFEEAGVHGRIEEAPFARYWRPPDTEARNSATRPGKEPAISAHLCEVLRLDPPQESGRNPTWFSPGKATRRLREGRKPEYAAEISGVIDRAVARIERQRSTVIRESQFERTGQDALQRVQFQAAVPRMEATLVRYVRREATPNGLRPNGYGRRALRQGRVLQIDAAPSGNEDHTTSEPRGRLPG